MPSLGGVRERAGGALRSRSLVVILQRQDPAEGDDPAILIDATGARGFWLIAEFEESALRPFGPDNWTFTPGTTRGAQVLIHAILDEPTVIVAAPMTPDKPLPDGTAAPSVIIHAYVSSAAAAQRWTKAGFAATAADISFTEVRATSELSVETAGGHVLKATITPTDGTITMDFELVETLTRSPDAAIWAYAHMSEAWHSGVATMQYGTAWPISPGPASQHATGSTQYAPDFRMEIGRSPWEGR